MHLMLGLMMFLRGVLTLGMWLSSILLVLSLVGAIDGLGTYVAAFVIALVLRVIVTVVGNGLFMLVHTDDPTVPTGKLYCNYPIKGMFENAIERDPDSVKLFYVAPMRRPHDYTARQAADQGIAHGFVFNMEETWSCQLFVDDSGSVRLR